MAIPASALSRLLRHPSRFSDGTGDVDKRKTAGSAAESATTRQLLDYYLPYPEALDPDFVGHDFLYAQGGAVVPSASGLPASLRLTGLHYGRNFGERNRDANFGPTGEQLADDQAALSRNAAKRLGTKRGDFIMVGGQLRQFADPSSKVVKGKIRSTSNTVEDRLRPLEGKVEVRRALPHEIGPAFQAPLSPLRRLTSPSGLPSGPKGVYDFRGSPNVFVGSSFPGIGGPSGVGGLAETGFSPSTGVDTGPQVFTPTEQSPSTPFGPADLSAQQDMFNPGIDLNNMGIDNNILSYPGIGQPFVDLSSMGTGDFSAGSPSADMQLGSLSKPFQSGGVADDDVPSMPLQRVYPWSFWDALRGAYAPAKQPGREGREEPFFLFKNSGWDAPTPEDLIPKMPPEKIHGSKTGETGNSGKMSHPVMRWNEPQLSWWQRFLSMFHGEPKRAKQLNTFDYDTFPTSQDPNQKINLAHGGIIPGDEHTGMESEEEEEAEQEQKMPVQPRKQPAQRESSPQNTPQGPQQSGYKSGGIPKEFMQYLKAGGVVHMITPAHHLMFEMPKRPVETSPNLAKTSTSRNPTKLRTEAGRPSMGVLNETTQQPFG